MSAFLEMDAKSVFLFCVSKNWSSQAWQLWKSYRMATAAQRGALLLGAEEARPEDSKHLLSGAAFDEFCQKQGFSELQRTEFEQRLWGRHDY